MDSPDDAGPGVLCLQACISSYVHVQAQKCLQKVPECAQYDTLLGFKMFIAATYSILIPFSHDLLKNLEIIYIHYTF